MAGKRDIRRLLAALEGQLAAKLLPENVAADIVARHEAKTYARQAYICKPRKDNERAKLERTLAKLQAKIAAKGIR